MKYFRGWISTPVERFCPGVTEKAICFTVAGGYTTANDTRVWFPKSQIKIGTPNECGNAEILVPCWLISKKAQNASDFFCRLREIGQYNGADYIVER